MAKSRRHAAPQVKLSDIKWSRFLLLTDPSEVEDTVLNRYPSQVGTFSFLDLFYLEALETLKKNPPAVIDGEPSVADIFSPRELVQQKQLPVRVIDFDQEHSLRMYRGASGLKDDQLNAIEVLLRIWRIRYYLLNIDFQAGFGIEKLCESIALDMMFLCFASIRGDFRTTFEPRIKRAALAEWAARLPRRVNNLSQEIEIAIGTLGIDAKNKALWQFLQAHRTGTGKVIIGMTRKQIKWLDHYNTEKTTSLQKFGKQVSRIKAKLRIEKNKETTHHTVSPEQWRTKLEAKLAELQKTLKAETDSRRR